MLTFTVHEPPNPPADRVDRAEGLVFIKDGFAWFAALFAPLWLLMHRLWWALLGYVVLAAVLQLAQKFGLLAESTAGLVMFCRQPPGRLRGRHAAALGARPQGLEHAGGRLGPHGR